MFSVIIPTIGRNTLAKTLSSCFFAGFDSDADEIIVVGDGQQPLAAKLVSEFPGRAIYTHTLPTPGCYGGPQRNRALELATKQWIVYIDDDDWFLPDARDIIFKGIQTRQGPVHIFRMRQEQTGKVLWEQPRVCWCNVSTQMVVHINDGPVPEWGVRYGHDYDFIAELLTIHGQDPVFHPGIITAIGHVKGHPEAA